MNSMVILTLISLIILAMGFTGIRLPFVSASPRFDNNESFKNEPKADNPAMPEFNGSSKVSYKVISKPLKPHVKVKRLKTFIPDNDEHLFRIRTFKRKVPGV